MNYKEEILHWSQIILFGFCLGVSYELGGKVGRKIEDNYFDQQDKQLAAKIYAQEPREVHIPKGKRECVSLSDIIVQTHDFQEQGIDTSDPLLYRR